MLLSLSGRERERSNYNTLHNHRSFLSRCKALCSNPIIAVDTKDIFVLCRFSKFHHIKYLNLDKIAAGSLYSSIVLLLRKMRIMFFSSSVMQPVQSIEKKKKNLKIYQQRFVHFAAHIAGKDL